MCNIASHPAGSARLLGRLILRCNHDLAHKSAVDGSVLATAHPGCCPTNLGQQQQQAAPQPAACCEQQPLHIQQLQEHPSSASRRSWAFQGAGLAGIGLHSPLHSAQQILAAGVLQSIWCGHPGLQSSRRGFVSSSSSTSSSGSSGNGGSSSSEQQQQQQQFLHGIHPSSEPQLSDLQQRIDSLNRSTRAARGSSSNGGHDAGPRFAEEYDSAAGHEAEVLSSFHSSDSPSGELRLRFRRKTPEFQVIEFYASGAAVEEYTPRTPQQLGLHPRDVTLFAPLSRLAAPQRATIAVHDGKILVKTEIVKAIITADKAVIIKSRRQRDTQKIAQAILAANDQRLMALKLHQHQQEQLTSSISPGVDGGLMGSCERAASAADLLRAANTGKRGSSARSTVGGASGGFGSGSGAAGGFSSAAGGGGLGGSAGFVQQTPGAGLGVPQGIGAGGFGVRSGGGGAGGAAGGRVLQPASVAAGSEAVTRAGGSELKDVPFEMLVLEVMLDATAEYFYTKVQHLNWMLESIAADIRQPGQPQGAMDKAHQLIPIQKFLTRVKNDVKETTEAIQAALEDDETLEELCLSWHLQQRQHTRWMPVELQRHRAARGEPEDAESLGGNGSAHSYVNSIDKSSLPSAGPAQQVRMLTEMLESYEREIQSLAGSINEAEEDLENTRSIWHMQLDSSRNHIIMVNLWLSMLNISVMATTILPAFFGMNLSSGLSEAEPMHFYAVCALSVFLSALSYPASRYWYNRNWRKINQNELFEQKMLRVLLVQNIEDVDEIIAALARVRTSHMDRKAFKALVVDTLGNRAMTPSHIDFLWQCFDRNRDGFLEEAELIRPLNTYHHGSNGYNDSSYDDSSRSAGPAYYAPSEYVQRQVRAGLVPSRLGSLEGLGSSSKRDQQGLGQGKGSDDDEGGPGRGGGRQECHAVRMSPKGQHQQPLEQQQQQSADQQQGSEQQQGSQQEQSKEEQGKKKKQEKTYTGPDWMDDERYNWD